MSRTTAEINHALDAPEPTHSAAARPSPAGSARTANAAPSKSRSTASRFPCPKVPPSSTRPKKLGIDTPTLCFLESLTPVNVCRVCVVELEGSRTLVPACSRKVEPNMSIKTDSERVRLSRRLVLEFLASSVDLSTAPAMQEYMERYDAHPERFGTTRATVAQPVKIDNDLYVRDYSKCVLCYKCVEACGVDAQNTFAIAVAGRGFSAHIATEFDVPLPDSACVYCGNCIGVCPTGALMFKSEYDMRQAGTWNESRQTQDRHHLSLLRSGLRSHRAPAGRADRSRDLAARPQRDSRQSLHQRPLRLAVRADSAIRQTGEITSLRCVRSQARGLLPTARWWKWFSVVRRARTRTGHRETTEQRLPRRMGVRRNPVAVPANGFK